MGAQKSTKVVPVQNLNDQERKIFNNKDLRAWLVSNYPPSLVFEFDRGNLPYQVFSIYLEYCEEKKS